MSTNTSHKEISDSDLILDIMCKEGDPTKAKVAFNEFYSRHAGYLLGGISKYFQILTEHERGQVVNDTFLKVWNQAELYDENKGKVRTWLFKIARNKALDMLGAKGKMMEDPKDPLESGNEDFWQEYAQRLPEEFSSKEKRMTSPIMKALKKAMDTLPDRDREIVVACAQNWPDEDPEIHKELAKRFKTTTGNIRVIKHRTHEKIKEALKGLVN